MDRKEALKIIADTIAEGSTVGDRIFALENEEEQALKVALEALREPERKKGQWERFHKYENGSDKWGYKCSECGNEIYDDDSSIIKNFLTPNFCEHCGADMRGDGE